MAKIQQILAKFAKFWEKTGKNSAIFNENFEMSQAVPGPYATSTANSTKSLTSSRATALATLPVLAPPRPGNSGDPARSHRPGRVSVHESRWHPMTPHLDYITFSFLFSPFQMFISRSARYQSGRCSGFCLRFPLYPGSA